MPDGGSEALVAKKKEQVEKRGEDGRPPRAAGDGRRRARAPRGMLAWQAGVITALPGLLSVASEEEFIDPPSPSSMQTSTHPTCLSAITSAS